MKSTEKEVLDYIVGYQGILNKPPTMNEIVKGCYTLNYRSSARYVIRRLLSAGYLETVAPKGCSRRYGAPNQ